jgi:hypothetical protein
MRFPFCGIGPINPLISPCIDAKLGMFEVKFA